MFIRFTVILFFLAGMASGQNLIPFPDHWEKTGGTLPMPEVITVSAKDRQFGNLIPLFCQSARKFYGLEASSSVRNGFIRLLRKKEIRSQEAYRLLVRDRGILIEAGTDEGCFNGLQSALQLIGNARTGGTLEKMVLEDHPRYAWRGLMLDESRHFFGMEEVKKILDLMALHKLNKFHWHLTDVPGWRIGISQYPRLTSEGGKGNHTDPDAAPAFYTQEQVREIVAYAAERFIEVIPEIDMPGHATAAVRAYPEYSGGGSDAYPDFTFNPGKAETYQFLTNILNEVTALFPSPYLHIGGDEVHFGNEEWNRLPEVRQLMEQEGLKDLVAVEHYFLHRMGDSLRVMGKTVAGWDEVVTAGLPADGTLVMWWRHDKPEMLKEAIAKGYEVVLCPRIPFYFDFVQDSAHVSGRKWEGAFAPVESVYRFPDPVFTGGADMSAPKIQGIQANVWTETIRTNERLEFMVFPRLSALAEAAWTEDGRKDPEDFSRRMDPMMQVYRRLGVSFFDYLGGGKEIPGPSAK